MLAANDCSWSAEVHRIELWRLNWRIEADLYKWGNVLTHTQQRSVLCLQNSVSAVLPCMLERICCNEVSGALEVFGRGEKQFAVLWTNAFALLNGLLITCLSLPSTASTVGWDPLKEPFYSQKSLQFVSCGQTNWSKLKPYLNSLFNTHIKSDLYWWLNKSTGTHSYTKPLKNLISSVCPVSPWIRDGRFHFCKKKQFGHLFIMAKKEERKGNLLRGSNIWGLLHCSEKCREFGWMSGGTRFCAPGGLSHTSSGNLWALVFIM